MQSLRRRIVSLPTTISETVKETPSKPFVQLGIIMTILFSLAVPALFYFSAQALAEFNTHKLISMQPWLSHYSSKLNNIAVAIVDNIDSAQGFSSLIKIVDLNFKICLFRRHKVSRT